MSEGFDLHGLCGNIPLLQGLSEDECQRAGKIATSLVLKQGEVVLHQGRQSQNLWTVLDGACEVVRRCDGDDTGALGEIVLATLKPYDSFGEMSFFQPHPHSAEVRTVSEVSLLRIRREEFDRLMAEDPAAAGKLALNLVGVLSERLRRMDRWVAELLGSTAAFDRVAEWSRFREKLFAGWTL